MGVGGVFPVSGFQFPVSRANVEFGTEEPSFAKALEGEQRDGLKEAQEDESSRYDAKTQQAEF
jgi:hypothetical protein